jgi:hypothetical protein
VLSRVDSAPKPSDDVDGPPGGSCERRLKVYVTDLEGVVMLGTAELHTPADTPTTRTRQPQSL